MGKSMGTVSVDEKTWLLKVSLYLPIALWTSSEYP